MMANRHGGPPREPVNNKQAPGERLSQKVQGDIGEMKFENLLNEKIPSNFEREQAHGSHRPDFVLTNDAGDRIAVVDSKTGAWADREQARAFLQLASEREPRALLIATEDGTDNRFTRAVKTELRDQPTIDPEQRVEVVVGTREEVAQKAAELAQQANERLQERELASGGAEQPVAAEQEVQDPGAVQSALEDNLAGRGAELPSGPTAEPPVDPSIMPDGPDISPGGNAA
jgi:hypothetical protein